MPEETIARKLMAEEFKWMENSKNTEAIFYFNSQYHMRDDELESIIKYFEDEDDPNKILSMKLIFIFKVLNQNQS
jgi:hypothetical protein